MQLGMATLAEYLDRWDGSYILAIASYNAGPGNVRNWVDAYGDPRDAGTDPIDWIESIPYPETRNYVQRVLENLEVYRNRLSNSDQKLQIVSDLYRASSAAYASRPDTSFTATAIEGGSAVIPRQPLPRALRRRNDGLFRAFLLVFRRLSLYYRDYPSPKPACRFCVSRG
jgi:hypothetical protein